MTTARATLPRDRAHAGEGAQDGRTTGAERSHLAAGFGDRIRRARLAAGYTHDRLAELTTLARRSLQYFESGERRPRRDSVRLLALTLDRDNPDSFETELLDLIGDSIREPKRGRRNRRRRRVIDVIERTGLTPTEHREEVEALEALWEARAAGWRQWLAACASPDIADIMAVHGIDYPRGIHFITPTDPRLLATLDVRRMARMSDPPQWDR